MTEDMTEDMIEDMTAEPQTVPDQTSPAIDPKRRFLCRHVFVEGHRCGSPALRGQPLCYNHGRARREAGIACRGGTFPMPRVDDRASVQLALYEVLSRLAGGDIDYKRGSILLYGLQIASANLPRRSAGDAQQQPQVEEVTADYDLGDLAPIAEIPTPDQAPQNAPAETSTEAAIPAETLTTTDTVIPTGVVIPTEVAIPTEILTPTEIAILTLSDPEYVGGESKGKNPRISTAPDAQERPALDGVGVTLTLSPSQWKNPRIQPHAPQLLIPSDQPFIDSEQPGPYSPLPAPCLSGMWASASDPEPVPCPLPEPRTNHGSLNRAREPNALQ